jgi:WD40 repeat protein
VALWDLERGERVGTYQPGHGGIGSLAFTSDPEVFAAGGQDGTVVLVDMREPSAAPMVLDTRDNAGPVVAASEARAFVASVGSDRTVRLWRADTLNLARTYRGRNSDVTAIDLSSDGRYLAAAGSDGGIRVWSSTSSRSVRAFKAHANRTIAIAFGPERLLATAGEDGKVKVWNLRTSRLLRTLGGSAAPIRALSFTHDGRRVIGSGQDGVIRVWSLDVAAVSGI